MTNVQFDQAVFPVHYQFSGADVTGASFASAVLVTDDIGKAEWAGEIAGFSDIFFSGVSFQSAFLNQVDFSSLSLSGVNFENAYLSGATFQGADLQGANFLNANMGTVNLSEAQLQLVKFAGTDLSNATLTGAVLPRVETCPDTLPEGWQCITPIAAINGEPLPGVEGMPHLWGEGVNYQSQYFIGLPSLSRRNWTSPLS